jgi:beta-phosphoglucomutase
VVKQVQKILETLIPLSETYSGCIFDFDGVIVDSEPVHAEAKQITLNHFKIKYPETIFSDFKGRPDSVFFNYVSKHLTGDLQAEHELHSFKNKVYLDLFNNVKLIDGIVPFLELCRFKFSTLAMATSATVNDLNLVFNKYELKKYFDVIVTGEDTVRHKPDPEPFLQALAAAGKTSSELFIIEDSPNGIIAGKAAGCFVAGITTSFDKNVLKKAGADIIVNDFMGMAEKL